jgi:hypothetical protein
VPSPAVSSLGGFRTPALGARRTVTHWAGIRNPSQQQTKVPIEVSPLRRSKAFFDLWTTDFAGNERGRPRFLNGRVSVRLHPPLYPPLPTVTVLVAVLFAVFGSGVELVTLAVFVTLP